MLKDIIYERWKEAYKNKNALEKQVFEQVKAKILIAEKSGKYELPLNDDVVIDLIAKTVNELKETQSCYYGKDVDKFIDIQVQINAIESYLPIPLTEEEVIEMIRQAKATQPNPGKVIGIVAKQVGSRFDKSKIAGLVKQL